MNEIAIKPEFVGNGDLARMARITPRCLQLKVVNGEISPEAFLLHKSGRRVALWSMDTAAKLRLMTTKK